MIGPPWYVMPLYFGVAQPIWLMTGAMPILNPAAVPTGLAGADAKVGRITTLKSTAKTERAHTTLPVAARTAVVDLGGRSFLIDFLRRRDSTPAHFPSTWGKTRLEQAC